MSTTKNESPIVWTRGYPNEKEKHDTYFILEA